jgi:high-affinity iron transporter
VGRILHTLVGYSDQPSALQLLVYILTLAAIFIVMRIFAHKTPVRDANRERIASV